ncbi:MAG: hypothetical protein ACTTK5_00395 [Candidatus Fimenecus sp.]
MKRNLGDADIFFDIPSINYFTQGNSYLGSVNVNFRYKIYFEDEKIKSEYWLKDVARSVIDETCVIKCKSLPATEENITNTIKTLYKNYIKEIVSNE